MTRQPVVPDGWVARKKPVEVQVIQYTDETRELVIKWIGEKCIHEAIDDEGALYELENIRIRTLEGEMMVRKLDWIIKGVKGEFYPCKPDIFIETYERVRPFYFADEDSPRT